MSVSKDSPTSPTSNVRSPSKRLGRIVSHKRRSAPVGSTSKDTIPEDEEVSHFDTEDMAASFLQYCAMCEKQILTPNNSILYCSEACRRKDSCKPLALAMSPINSPPASAPSSPRPTLPARTPTGSFRTPTPTIRIPEELHNAKADLDPTEWKPKLHRRVESEASRYLIQFHRITSSEENPKRTHVSHRSTTSIASLNPPSLAETPSTAPSSMSTNEYDFNTRPLQSRHNPLYSGSAGATKGVELVMPHYAPPIAVSQPASGTYAKRTPSKATATASGSLGALLGIAEAK